MTTCWPGISIDNDWASCGQVIDSSGSLVIVYIPVNCGKTAGKYQKIDELSDMGYLSKNPGKNFQQIFLKFSIPFWQSLGNFYQNKYLKLFLAKFTSTYFSKTAIKTYDRRSNTPFEVRYGDGQTRINLYGVPFWRRELAL